MSLQLIIKSKTTRLIVSLVLLGVVLYSHSQTAAAAYIPNAPCPPPPAQLLCPLPGVTNNEPPIPANIQKNNLEIPVYTGCNGLAAVYGLWISTQSKTDYRNTNITVNYGATSVPIQFNDSTAICDPGNRAIGSFGPYYAASPLREARFWYIGGKVTGPDGAGSVVQTGGNMIDFNYDCPYLFCGSIDHHHDRGFYIHGSLPYNITVPGGFKTSGTYTVTLTYQGVVHDMDDGGGNNVYLCLDTPPRYYLTSGWNYRPTPNECQINTVQAQFSITVIQPKKDTPQTGNLAVTCNGIVPTFGDADGGTKADLYINGAVTPLTQSQSGRTIPIPSSAAYTASTYKLMVYDHQPDGSYTGPTQEGATITLPPCSNLSCVITLTPSGVIEPSQTYSLKAVYSYGTGPTPAAINNKTFQVNGQNQAFTTSSDPANHAFTFSMNSPPQLPAGSYSVTSSATVGSQTANCNTTLTIANKPYLQVYGNDVTAGGGVPEVDASFNPVCPNPADVNNSAQIYSWNKANDPQFPWSGAGGQFGVRAMKNITGFVTDFSSTVSGVAKPVALSFSSTNNNSPTSNPGQFGGFFANGVAAGQAGPSLGCDTGDITSIQNPNTTASTIGSTTVFSTTPSIEVHGDIYITGNITYAGGWNSVSDIPNFKVVALGGNIYIDPNVTQLDGSYYALPAQGVNHSSTGFISTCGTPATKDIDGNSGSNDNFGRCFKQLVVHGSLKAGQIHFYRSCGTLRLAQNDARVSGGGGVDPSLCSATNHAAEVIISGPDSWLGQGGGGQATYDSISSLPPVL